MERVKVRTDELLPKFKSKSDLYNVCKYQRMYLILYALLALIIFFLMQNFNSMLI